MTTNHRLDVRYIVISCILSLVVLGSSIFFKVTFLDIFYLCFVAYAAMKYIKINS